MPEVFFLFFSLFVIVPIFYFLQIPVIYMEILLVVVSVMMLVPLVKTLFNAPFVPSKKKRIDKMMQLANLDTKKTVTEIGCGDGRIIRQVAAKGVKKAVGFDISIVLVLYGKLVALLKKNSAKIRFGDIWQQNYQKTDVIFSYLLPIAMKKVKNIIWPQLPKNARLVSNAFPLPGIKEDKKEDGVYLYIKK